MAIPVIGALPPVQMQDIVPGEMFVAYSGPGHLICMRGKADHLDPVIVFGSRGTYLDRQTPHWVHAHSVSSHRLVKLPDAQIEILAAETGLPEFDEYNANGSIILTSSGSAWIFTQINVVNQATFSLDDGSWSAPDEDVQSRYGSWRIIRKVDGMKEPLELLRYDRRPSPSAQAANS